jgi:acetolactate synthase-1/2/3 large subunit
MSLHELATAVTYKAPIVVLIMNNGVLGMVRQWQKFFFDKRYSNTELDRKTDFVALAKSFGADGIAVNSVEELDNALKIAFSSELPFIIDCAVDKDELVLPMLPPGGSMDDIIVKAGG